MVYVRDKKAESDLAMANRILVLAETFAKTQPKWRNWIRRVEGTGSVTTKNRWKQDGKNKEIKPDIENEQKSKNKMR